MVRVANQVSRDGVFCGLVALAMLALGCGAVDLASSDGGQQLVASSDAGAVVAAADAAGDVVEARELEASAAADVVDGRGDRELDASDAAEIDCYVYVPASYRLPDGAAPAIVARKCAGAPGCNVCRWGADGPEFNGAGCSAGGGVHCVASCDVCP